MVTVNNLLLFIEFDNIHDKSSVKFTFKRYTLSNPLFQKMTKLNSKYQDEILSLINMEASLRDNIYIVCPFENKNLISTIFPKLCERSVSFLDLSTYKALSAF
jgi:hypothetical protein